MVINYNGKSYFKFQVGEKIILLNPLDQRSLKTAKIVLNTIDPPPFLKEEKNELPIFISNAGEYDIDEIRIYGKQIAYEDNKIKTAYKVFFEDINIGILPLLQKIPELKNLEILENSHILIIQAPAKGFLSSLELAKIVRQLEPGIIIPYFIDNTNPKEFFKELGKENISLEEKITLKKKDIIPSLMELRVIKPSTINA